MPERIRSRIWKSVQANLGKFQKLFGSRFYIIDNEIPGKPVGVNTVSGKIRGWASKEANNPAANAWKKEQRKILGLEHFSFSRVKKILRS